MKLEMGIWIGNRIHMFETRLFYKENNLIILLSRERTRPCRQLFNWFRSKNKVTSRQNNSTSKVQVA